MLLVFKLLWDKIGAYVLLGLGALAVLFKYGYDKKQEGARDLRDKINKETQDVQKKWDEIDRRSTDVDNALDRLSGNRKD